MKKISSLSDVALIKLPNFVDTRGGLTVVSEQTDVPFRFKRMFFTYNTQFDVSRGEHAHKTCSQFLICPHGNFDVDVTDGTDRKTFRLGDPSFGLFIPPLIWSIQKNYSESAVCLVLASEKYSRSEYVYSFQEFLRIRKLSE
jgi:dTDP-4-dehydrorhamnose 3,5-epimerase-like enzyme